MIILLISRSGLKQVMSGQKLMCMKLGPNVCVHDMSNDFYIGDVRSITKSAGQLKK